MQEPGMVESLSKNITRQGLTNTTLNYLRVTIFITVFREHSQMTSHKVGGGALVFVGQKYIRPRAWEHGRGGRGGVRNHLNLCHVISKWFLVTLCNCNNLKFGIIQWNFSMKSKEFFILFRPWTCAMFVKNNVMHWFY